MSTTEFSFHPFQSPQHHLPPGSQRTWNVSKCPRAPATSRRLGALAMAELLLALSGPPGVIQGAVFLLTYTGYHAQLSPLKSNLKFSTILHFFKKINLLWPKRQREVHLWQSFLKSLCFHASAPQVLSSPSLGGSTVHSYQPATASPVRWMSTRLSTHPPILLSTCQSSHPLLPPHAFIHRPLRNLSQH